MMEKIANGKQKGPELTEIGRCEVGHLKKTTKKDKRKII